MEPVSFEESNATLAGGPPEKYGVEVVDLAVHKGGEYIVSAWQPTWRERLSVLIFGRVWLYVRAITTHPPVALTGKRSIFNE